MCSNFGADFISFPALSSRIFKLSWNNKARSNTTKNAKVDIDDVSTKVDNNSRSKLMDHPDYVAGNYTTKFMEDFEMKPL